jgi:hypothetical protein
MEPASCTGTRSCHAISEIVINVVKTLLHDHAHDGTVDLADVDRLLGLIQRGTVTLDHAFQAQEDKCRKCHSRPKGNVGARSNPFQRLIVRPFEHLLMGENAVLARPYLANYFDFINYALADVIDEVERESRAVIQALLVVHGNNLTWDHFYSDGRTLKVLHRALKVLTQVLASPEGTKAWGKFMHRPAGDLPPPGIPQLNQIRDALLETHRGLSAGV